MTPSLTQVEVEAPPAPVKAMGHLATKEAFITGPKAFNLEAETKGTAKQPPASHPNYLPIWDNEEGT
jgi:sulfonate dioxygenase